MISSYKIGFSTKVSSIKQKVASAMQLVEKAWAGHIL
jgi:hypothetical protein